MKQVNVDWYYRCWDETRVIWPHRCWYTNRWLLPFTKAMRSRVETDLGPTSILYLDYVALWTTPDELIIQKLKGNG